MQGLNAVAAMKTYSFDDSQAHREDVARAINSFRRTCDLPLHVFDDASCRSYQEYLLGFKGIFVHTHSENVGPGGSTNRSLALFEKYHEIDAIILLDDDIEFLKAGWAEAYLDGLTDEIQILSFNDPNITKFDNAIFGKYAVAQWTCGVCVTVTRYAWRKAGFLGPFPEKYGCCHIEYFQRCATKGLVPLNGFYDIAGSEEFIKINSWDVTAEKTRQVGINEQSATFTKTGLLYRKMQRQRLCE